MALVVLIDEPDKLDDHTEQDMRRWWRQHAKKHVREGEVFFEVMGKLNLYGGCKRLWSFGVPARVVRRAIPR